MTRPNHSSRVTPKKKPVVDSQFPLVVADRFFEIVSTDAGFTANVYRWTPGDADLMLEVKDGEVIDAAAATNPTGTITWQREDGGFEFKFRPKEGVSQIFGSVPTPDGLKVHVRDRGVEYDTKYLEYNQVAGSEIGLWIKADGGVAVGARLPPGFPKR